MSHVAVRPSLDILSICTGGGGLDLGVELAIPSARSVVLVEREAFAVAQLVSAMEAGLLHQAPIWSDARTFDGRRWRGCVDGLIGGIPCQPHSMAGRKLGQNDERDLWSDARRIIVQSGVWFVVIENVGGMLSAGDDEIAGAERVWRDLRKLGFAVEGGLFTAAEVGAPHQRERVFILGVADTSRYRQQRCQESHFGSVGPGQQASRWRHAERCDRDVGDAAGQRSYATSLAGTDCGDEGGRTRDAQPQRRGGNVESESVADAAGSGWRSEREERGPERGWRSGEARRLQSGRLDSEIRDRGLFPPGPGARDAWRNELTRSPELEPAFRRVADGLASRLDIARVDRLRMLGNGVVPLQAAYAVRTLATRLADRGSAGATRLVRMMEQQP